MQQLSKSQLALYTVLVGSLGVNVLQGTRILKLEQALDQASPGQVLTEGARLSPLDVRGTTGGAQTIAFSSAATPTVLYVFSASCVWCQKNAVNLAALREQLGQKVRLIGLSLSDEGLETFKVKGGMDFPVYVPSPATVKSYHLGQTPATLVVSASGVLLKMWAGAYTGLTKKAIEEYFDVTLPTS